MAYERLNDQPPPREDGLNYDAHAPGLYSEDEEIVVKLDSGELVALSIFQKWLDNNGGYSIKACARWVNPDGSTVLDPHKQHIETWGSHNASAWEVKEFGLDALTKDVIHLSLGEELQVMKEYPLNEAGDIGKKPVIDVHDDVKMNSSIRHAIGAVSQARASTASSVLGL